MKYDEICHTFNHVHTFAMCLHRFTSVSMWHLPTKNSEAQLVKVWHQVLVRQILGLIIVSGRKWGDRRKTITRIYSASSYSAKNSGK